MYKDGVEVKKRVIITTVIVLLIFAGLCILASKPIISGGNDVPEDYVEKIKSQAQGLYSKVLPLVPIYVTIDSFEEEKVYYTIHYFPFGTVEMSYIESEGYNIEKPLTGL